MAFTVIDDFVGDYYQTLMEELFSGIQWMYQKDMDYSGNSECDVRTHSQFMQPLFRDGNVINPQVHFSLVPMIYKIMTHNIEPSNYYLSRSRAILHVPNTDKPKHFNPHVDEETEGCISAIYYVCDSDGDTILFKESHDDVEVKDIDGHNFTEVDRVSPKKGRLVLFSAAEYHCGSPPSKSDRMLVNFNFERLLA